MIRHDKPFCSCCVIGNYSWPTVTQAAGYTIDYSTTHRQDAHGYLQPLQDDLLTINFTLMSIKKN